MATIDYLWTLWDTGSLLTWKWRGGEGRTELVKEDTEG